MYRSVTSTFTAPFALAGIFGPLSAVWMGLKTFIPTQAAQVKEFLIGLIRRPQEVKPLLDTLSFADQCTYAENILRTMGLTRHFAPLVVFCGHGSRSENNAYATGLDCGACGGHHGGGNARLLAAIMSQPDVQAQLAKNGIVIPATTRFIAAEHTTSTNEVTFYGTFYDPPSAQLETLKKNIEKARFTIAGAQCQKKGSSASLSKALSRMLLRSYDFAEVRPEKGLAGNAAFIIAPRDLSFCLDLEGRCFLHSYDYTQDPQGLFLTSILTAPMIVSQWINMQSFFSALDPIAYGGGSKLTQNMTGHFGIMQGNASDMMTGLSLQSIYRKDNQLYDQPQRLMAVVFAPRSMLDKIIPHQPVLKKLFGNGWAHLAVIEPDTRTAYQLNRDFSWQETVDGQRSS